MTILDESFRLDLIGFQKWLELSGVSKNTIKAYISDVKLCLSAKKELEPIRIENYSIDDWRECISLLQERNLTNRSCDRYFSSLKAFSKYKKSKGVRLAVENLRVIKKEKSRLKVKYLDFESVQKFLCFFKNPKGILESRDCTLVFLLYSVGLRVNEALALKWSDFYFKHIVVRGKGNKIRHVPLFPFLKDMLAQYRKQLRGENQYVFVSNTQKTRLHACAVARKFRGVSALLGVDITPHSLRHACATHLLRNGCDLRYIQSLLGHSSLEITKLYINCSFDDLKTDFFKFCS